MGSRGSEVGFLTRAISKNCFVIKEKYPDLQFLVPLVNEKRRQQFEEIKARIAPDLDMHLIDGKARQVMIAAEATLLASGTAALEAMLCKSANGSGVSNETFHAFLGKNDWSKQNIFHCLIC